jgi:Tol biopolymer transport system component
VAATPGADDLEGSFAPGGRRIVYVRQAAGAGGSSGTLVIADLAGHHVKVTALSGAAPEFMPDGRRIAYIGAGGGVWTATTQGRRLRRLIAAARSFEISHDGRQIAYVAPGGALYLARIDGSHRRRVASEPDGTDPIEAVRFSPDGKLLAFAAQGSTGGETLYTVPTRGGGFSAISSTGDPRAVTTGLSWQRLGT